MIPQTPQDLYKKLAENNPDIPLEHIKELVTLYYTKVRRDLSSLVHIKVDVRGLGQFQIKHWLVDKATDKVANWENLYDGHSKNDQRLQHTRLLYIQDMLYEDHKNKQRVKLLKDEYYRNKDQQGSEAQKPLDTQK